eukprot:2891816-Rhodomonas_salina.1
MFMNGPAGTGKTTVMKAVVDWVSSQHLDLGGTPMIAQVCALTWLAASNFEHSVSLHNLFRIMVNDVAERILCNPSNTKTK